MTTSAGRPSLPSSERWVLLEEALDDLLALPSEQRGARLSALCARDAGLHDELTRMLLLCERIERESQWLDRPAAERFAALFEDPDDAARLAAGVADRYVLEAEAGRGGMAIVYRARDVRHGRVVAFKAMQRTLSDESARRFRQEIALAASLQHPHIIPVFDSGESGGRLWYTMPFIEGETLGTRLRRGGAFEIAEAIRVVREMADALEYAHTRGIIHRDLKPDNVLLSQGHAVVADLGVAMALAAARDVVPLAAANPSGEVRVGTPAYMAPEQLAGDRGLDHRADLYALGVIAFELLTGVLPSRKRSSSLPAGGRHASSSISSYRADVPRRLERLVERLMEADPADRSGSGAEVLAELNAIEVSASGTGDVVSTTPRNHAALHRAAWTGAAAVVVGIAALGYLVSRGQLPLPPAVASRLDPRLTHWLMGSPPVNSYARTAFTYGLDLMTAGNSIGAIESWKQAANLDSTYMQPRLHAAAVLQGSNPAAADSLLIPVERRRRWLAPGDAAMLNYIRGSMDGRLEDAYEAGEALIRAEPDAELPYFFMEIVATRVRRPWRAIEASKRVDYRSGRFRLPGAAGLHFTILTEAYHQLGQHDKELEQARVGRALHPDNLVFAGLELRALAAMDGAGGVEPIVDQMKHMKPTYSWPSATWMVHAAAAELAFHGHESHAVRALLESALEMAPAPSFGEARSAIAVFDRARSLYLLGRYREAKPLFEELVRRRASDPQYPIYLSYYAVTLHRLNQVALAVATQARLDSLRRPYDQGMTPYARAQLAAQLGDTRQALALLARAFHEGMPVEGYSFHADLMLEPVWHNVGFSEIVRPRQ